MVSIDAFTVTSSTSAVVSWLPLDETHHNDEAVNYTVRLINLNMTTQQTFSIDGTSYNLTGIVL